jgi:hypothetical protein
MKTLLFLTLLMSSLYVQSQDLKKLVVNIKDTFNSQAAIYVETKPSDIIRAADFLKNNLAMNDFKVVTDKTKADYEISFSYQWRTDTGCDGRVIKNMTGQILDLKNDGAIIGTFTFTQNSLEGKCADKIMLALVNRLKKK